MAGRVSKYEEDCEAYRKAYIADCMVNRMMDSKMNSMMDDMLDNMLDEHKFNPKLLELAEKLQGRRLLLDEVRRLGIEIGLLSGETDDRLNGFVQLLVLRGFVRLEAGMQEERLANQWMGWTRKMTDWLDRVIRNTGRQWSKRQSDRRNMRCGRCNSGSDKHHRTPCAVCGRECVYCEACLQMGRVRECSVFVIGCGKEAFDPDAGAQGTAVREQAVRDDEVDKVIDKCGISKCGTCGSSGNAGVIAKDECHERSRSRERLDEQRMEEMMKKWKLSTAQEAASRDALRFVMEPAKRAGEQYLIWAVTGAGKTEMVFPLVEYVVRRGGRVLLTAPRRDVVLELAPRLAKAFPESEVIALYGGSEHRWEIGEITVATTHQLLRIERCFDLVILDELDAYPYHGNPMLAFAAGRACKVRGKTVLLTATPPREQQIAMRQRRLPHAMVPVRYHRHPLPVPRILRYRGLSAALGSGRLPSALRAALDESLQRGAQIFVFVPRIEHVEPLTRLLRRACAHAVDADAVDGTSSRDPDRASRVRRFRSGEIRILVTTTILERGVTIPRSDVYIMDADAALFDEAALVQMAGRAGRSADDPCGRVYYVARSRTDGLTRAVRQIRAMNALARRRGLLIEPAARREANADV